MLLLEFCKTCQDTFRTPVSNFWKLACSLCHQGSRWNLSDSCLKPNTKCYLLKWKYSITAYIYRAYSRRFFFGYESNIQIGALSKKCQKCFLFCVFFSIFAPFTLISPVIRQKDKFQNGGNKKSKHPKFLEKRTFTPWYTHVINICFSENLACFTFLLPPFRDSPFCRFLTSCYLFLETSHPCPYVIEKADLAIESQQ